MLSTRSVSATTPGPVSAGWAAVFGRRTSARRLSRAGGNGAELGMGRAPSRWDLRSGLGAGYDRGHGAIRLIATKLVGLRSLVRVRASGAAACGSAGARSDSARARARSGEAGTRSAGSGDGAASG